MINRRNVLIGSSLAALAATVRTSFAQSRPLKIGLLVPLSGPSSFEGASAVQGFNLYMKLHNNTFGGIPVEVFQEDDQGKPDTGLERMRKLVEQEGVDLVIGTIVSPVALACKEYADRRKFPFFVLNAVADAVTAPDKASPYVARVMASAAQANRPFGEWIAKNTDYKRIHVIALDYAPGHDSSAAFKAGFEANGGKIVSETFAPPGTSDYAPFLGRIDAAAADATYAWMAGSDAVRFVRQWQETGLKDKMPLIGFAGITEDMILPEVKDAALGHLVITPYTTRIESEQNRAFVEAFNKEYNAQPSLPASNGWITAQIVDDVVTKAGAIPERDQFIPAIAGTKIETPRGHIEFDENRQVICDLFIARAEEIDGQIENHVLETIQKVRQFAS